MRRAEAIRIAFRRAADGFANCRSSRRYWRSTAAQPATTGAAMLVPPRYP